MYIDAMSEVLERSNKVFLDVQSGNSLMYLPLDKLMERSVGAAAAVPSITSPVSTSSSTPTRSNNTQQRIDSRTRGSN